MGRFGLRRIFMLPKGTFKFIALPELKDQWVFDILQEKNGTFWFATMGKGAWKYNPQDNTFKHYTNKDGASNKAQSHSISSNSISSLMQDSKGNVWLSTDRGGLCRYNPKEDNFTRFSVEEGMPDDVAYKVLEDDYGYLWFGTNRGLVRFKPETKRNPCLHRTRRPVRQSVQLQVGGKKAATAISISAA